MIAVVREMPAPMNRGNLPPRNKVDGGEKRFNTISRWILEHKFAQAAALWARDGHVRPAFRTGHRRPTVRRRAAGICSFVQQVYRFAPTGFCAHIAASRGVGSRSANKISDLTVVNEAPSLGTNLATSVPEGAAVFSNPYRATPSARWCGHPAIRLGVVAQMKAGSLPDKELSDVVEDSIVRVGRRHPGAMPEARRTGCLELKIVRLFEHPRTGGSQVGRCGPDLGRRVECLYKGIADDYFPIRAAAQATEERKNKG